MKKKFTSIIRKYNPDILFTFQAKPNMLGCIAGKKAGVQNIYSMVEGLGDPFQPKTTKDKILYLVISFLYKKAFKICKKIFVLNNDDKSFFIRKNFLKPEKCVVVPGIGIDTNTWDYHPIINFKRVIMLSRLIPNKGIFDFCEAATKVKERLPDVEFVLAGNESEITEKDLEKYSAVINYLGSINNVKDEIINSSILVLPTYYREGFPRSILEAMSLGRPVVATNYVGCRDAIIHDYNGLLFEPHDIDKFVELLLELLTDKDKMNRYGKNGRIRVVELFDSKIINEQIYIIIKADH